MKVFIKSKKTSFEYDSRIIEIICIIEIQIIVRAYSSIHTDTRARIYVQWWILRCCVKAKDNVEVLICLRNVQLSLRVNQFFFLFYKSECEKFRKSVLIKGK